MQHVAVLGLGAMGGRMAARLVAAGHTVSVWNRSPERVGDLARRVRVAATPREAAIGADAVLSMLTDDQAAREVWLADDDGALHGLRSGALAIESSSTTPGWTKELADRIRTRGARVIDAPVVGSRGQAELGQLIHLVGGDAVDVGDAAPVLAAVGNAVHHVGPLGTGAAMKLAVNALFATQVLAYAEWMSLLRQQGFTASRLAEILGALPIASPAARGAMALIASGDVTPLFPMALVEKDLRYALSLEAANGERTPLTHATWVQFGRAMSAGFGGDNITGIAQMFTTPGDVGRG